MRGRSRSASGARPFMLVRCCMLSGLCDDGRCDVDVEYDSEKQRSSVDWMFSDTSFDTVVCKEGTVELLERCSTRIERV